VAEGIGHAHQHVLLVLVTVAGRVCDIQMVDDDLVTGSALFEHRPA
jgi:hypothetical protein